MTDIDSSDIRKFIFKENIFDAYKDYCEIRGNMDYVDFEWKYYQLYHGNREERSPLTFSDLPMDVLGKVIEKLSLFDRLILRDVSRDLRNLTDSTEAYCEKIDFYFGCGNFKIEFENVLIYYELIDDECWSIIYSGGQSKTRKLKQNHNCKQAMIDDAATILKNPKLRIGHIRFEVPDGVFIFAFLKRWRSLNIQLNVRSIDFGIQLNARSIDFDSAHSMVALLQILNPDKLEEVSTTITVIEFIRIVETNSAILKNPKLKWGCITFDVYSDALLTELTDVLKSIDLHHNFRLIIIDGRWINPILHSLDPDIIEGIVFKHVTFSADQFNELAGMEKQWRRKTCLVWCRFPEYGLEHFLNFKTFQSDRFDINDENLVKIRDNLLKSHHLKTFRLESYTDRRPIHVMYEQLDRIMSQNPAYDVETRRMSIPISRDHFQLECDTSYEARLLEIRRISEN